MAAFSAEQMRSVEPVPSAPDQGPNPHEARLVALAESMAGHDIRPAYSPIVIAGLVRLLELVVIMLTGSAVYYFYIVRAQGFSYQYGLAISGMTLLAGIVFHILGINNVQAFRAPISQGLRLIGGWTIVFMAALAAIFFLKLEGVFSRVWLMSWFVVGLGALMIERGIISYVVRSLTRAGRLDRRTVIVGGGPIAEDLLKDLASQPNSDLRICGVFDDRTDDRSPDVVAGYPKLGRVDDLVEFARHTRLDLVIFTLPITAETRLLTMLRKLWVLPIDIRLAAHANKLRFRPRAYSYIGSVPVFDVFDKPIADWDVLIKAIFDRVIGAIALVLLSPIMLAVAIAVKLNSKGPVLFKQKRHGFNNEIVEVYKFRSMYTDKSDFDAKVQVSKNDPRVTSVGRIIRKTSLDELPQLFNVVFKGNLSLVGPRPHAISAEAHNRKYDEVVDGYFARHRVRPGMTGWAQINGWRGETDTPEKIQRRVECDLYYIENWSLLLDIYILAVTPFALLKTENAY